jgi:phosphatidylinositol alpha-1,6-mannosyltransferase
VARGLVKRHLLVTNDFPPKVGGIQNYLWELWRRLDPDSFVVLTASSDPGAAAFDAAQAARGVRIERVSEPILFFPTPGALRQVRRCVAEYGIDLVLLDPALPLGLLGPRLGVPYGVILHGAEVTVPGRLPVARTALGHVLRGSSVVISAGGYPAAEGRRAAGELVAPVIEIPPGVDASSIKPMFEAVRQAARVRFGLPSSGPLVVSLSRLVPRKGMDVLIEAAGRLIPSYPDLALAIGGEGRDLPRLRRQAEASPASVTLLGRLSDEDRAVLLGAADIFVMACRNRWLGLEQEGFGIVFLEAAAAGVPQVAGDSGGAAEAVIDGETGLVVARPEDPGCVAAALRELLADPERATRMGAAGRARVVASFDYDVLASRLAHTLEEVAG